MVVVGIYVLPGVTAKFQGSHTMEFNASSTGVTNSTEMDCGACHAYIESELNATGVLGTAGVIKAHIRALNDRAYTNDNNSFSGGFLEIGNITIGYDEPGKVCPLCHAAETKIDGSHTQVVTRVCTDADCHGYNSTHPYARGEGGNITYAGQNITEKLNLSADVHSGWYWEMESLASTRDMANSSYPNSYSGKYGKGYLTCLACHTHFGMNLNITRPQSFNITITINSAGDVAVSNVVINATDLNETMSYKKAHDSVWW
jgi:hypothetical protein